MMLQQAESPLQHQQSSEQLKILIVDDRRENHRVIESILEEIEADYYHAFSGEQALKLALRHSFAVILLDVMMPGMDGFETASLLRVNEETRATPIIFITAADRTEELEFKGYEVGAIDYLFKPINAHTLASKVSVFLELERQRIGLRRTMERLQMQETKNRLLLHSIGEGIIGLDQNGHITFINPATEKLLKVCELDIVGHHIAEYIGADMVGDVSESWTESPLYQQCRRDKPFHREFSLFSDTEKNFFPVEYTATPVYDDGNFAGIVIAFQDITQRRRIEEQLARLAQYDSLTGLLNRYSFEKSLKNAIARAKRSEHRFALLFLDLDHFKQINDNLGHEVGDLLLQQASTRIVETVRESDTLGRIGGDEFLLILDLVDEPCERNAAAVAEKILAAITEPFHVRDHELYLGVSIGIAIYPGSGETVEKLMRASDLAMYRAKTKGRNNYRFFTEEMQQQAHNALDLESRLRIALAQEQFLLYYQPKLDLASNRVVGVEALVRWQTGDGELVGPDRFIPKLEDMGKMSQLGHWVIRAACQQLQDWRRQGLEEISIAINLSVKQLNQGNLPKLVRDCLASFEIRPEQLEFEITESLMMSDPERASAILGALRELGIPVSVDDFGTGYSSLAYLQALPLDALKIDRMFVKRLHENEQSHAIVRTIIGLAHNMGLKVIAEGVEEEAQLTMLREEGCDQIQGYYLSRPLPPEQFVDWLRQLQ
ncbi:EAL domain-containing protein [Gallaecimonas sp. GXIMD4217]|uniref:putative bifunctional diguanylate cyclase/phosphodiesterase n=1 Tax=Gallaecimonas sp. GXIMD4217 TaxID=3131927 RepID=UPI00311AEB38